MPKLRPYSETGLVCIKGHPITEDSSYTTPSGFVRCRECLHEAQARYNEAHLDRRRQVNRVRNAKRIKDPAYRLLMREMKKKYDLNNKFKNLARQRLQRAVRAGYLPKESACSRCEGNIRLEAHHYDYNRAYDVLWLCHKCHSWIHWALVKEAI